MRADIVITRVGCVAAAIGLGSWLAVEHQARLRAGEEHKALEQQLEQTAGLTATNEELSNQVARASGTQSFPDDPSAELLRLRDEAGRLRQQSKELEAVRKENREARAAGGAATADYWPRNSWTFAGFGSPEAALKTSLWAANNGDLKTLLASTTGDLGKMMQAELGGKSDTEASIRAMDNVMNFKSVRLVNSELQANDTAVLTVTIEERTETHTGKLFLRKIGNDWKLSGIAE